MKKCFCVFYDYAGIADVSKGYWNPKKKIAGNHVFFLRELSNNDSNKK